MGTRRNRARQGALCIIAAGLVGLVASPAHAGHAPKTSTGPPVAMASGDDCDAGARGGFVGIGGTESLNHPPYAKCVLGLQALSGISVVRQTFDRADVERAPGRYDFSAYDWWVAIAASKKIRILALLFGAPAYEGRQPHGWTRAPRSAVSFARFAAAAVERYGPDGSFWEENPSLPKMPIRSWQVWNEPNLSAYWYPRPDAAAYTRLLSASAGAIKSRDPDAEIVTAGLPDSRQGVPFRRFLTAMYRAGAKDAFDTLGLNVYSRRAANVIRSVRRARRLTARLTDPMTKMWLTEVGWATAGPDSRFRVGSRGQARELRALLRGLRSQRRRLRLRGVVYFGWQDGPPYPPLFRDAWGLHTGLFTLDGRAKPAYWVLRRMAPRLR